MPNRTIKRKIAILGTRGVPCKHGGFEIFAEYLALYLVSKCWEVSVYCQDDDGDKVFEEIWNGICLVHIPLHCLGAAGTVIFDWKSTVYAPKEKKV